jgi:hypothetical protein
MKRAITLLVAAAIGLTVAHLSAQAQSSALPTVDQVIEKYVTAAGGREAMEKVTSRVSTGTFEIADAGMSGSITISEKAPNKSMALIDLPGMGQVREACDGTVAWEDAPGAGVREKAGAELADAVRGCVFNAELQLMTLYKTVVVSGKEAIEGKDAYVVVATPAEGAVTKLYFDVASGLMVRQSSTRETPQGPMDVDVLISDYRAVDGVKMPFSIRQVSAMATVVIKIAAIKQNVPIDDAIFKTPGF